MKYVLPSKTTNRTKSEIASLLKEATLDLEKGLETGQYVEPWKTNMINWRSGEAYNRMTSYISDLKRELTLPYSNN